MNFPATLADPYLRPLCVACSSDILSAIERTAHPCRHSPAVISLIPAFLSAIKDLLENSAEVDRLSGLSALSRYCTSSPVSFRHVLTNRPLITSWIALLRGQPSIQGPVLHCIAQVLLFPFTLLEDSQTTAPTAVSRLGHLSSSTLSLLRQHSQPSTGLGDSDTDLSALLTTMSTLKKGLFDSLYVAAGKGVSSMDLMLKLAKQPIPEVRVGAVDVMRSLAYQEQPWALHLMVGHAGFYAYLQVRSFISLLPPSLTTASMSNRNATQSSRKRERSGSSL
jgi:hypothetical protein